MITFVFYNAFHKQLGRATGSIGEDIEVPFNTCYFTIESVSDEDIVRRGISVMDVRSKYPPEMMP